MTIHHAIAKKAVKLGVVLEDLGEEDGLTRYKAFWPKYATAIFGSTAKEAIDDMVAAMDIRNNWASFKVSITTNAAGQDVYALHIRKADFTATGTSLSTLLAEAKTAYQAYRADLDIDDEEADDEDQAEIEAEADAENEEAKATGTVVAAKYRSRYAEAGHPDHCGDWLAETLNNFCKNKAGFDLDTFAMICSANEIDMSKYPIAKPSDRGRYRMTGRNMLSRIVYKSGELRMPETLNGGEPFSAPAEWKALVAPRYAKAKS